LVLHRGGLVGVCYKSYEARCFAAVRSAALKICVKLPDIGKGVAMAALQAHNNTNREVAAQAARVSGMR
jgi:hypothetical protein